MAIDPDTLTQVLALGQTCEDLAGAALNACQAQLKLRAITQDDFDQAFQDYGVAMQRARDMYYQASHSLTEEIAALPDLKALNDQTAELTKSLSNLQKVEHALSISFGALTVIAAIATAVTVPTTATLGAVATASMVLKTAILT